MCFEIYERDPAKLLWAPRPGLAWKAAFKKSKIKIDILTNISMYQYAKANSKYVKDYKENKEVSYLHYWDVNNLYGLLMSEKLPVNNFSVWWRFYKKLYWRWW